MKAPGLVPTLETHERLLILPDARPRRRWPLILGVVALAAWTAAVAGIGVYLWQRDEADERGAALAQTRAANDELSATVDRLNAQIADLRADISTTQTQLVAAQMGLAAAQGATSHELSNVRALQVQLSALQSELRSAVGPQPSHGTHIAYVMAVDVTASRVVLDLGRWFTGQPARRAALADGAIAPNEHLHDGRYLRDADHVWRVVHVRSLTHVTLRHYAGANGPTVVSIATLASIFRSGRHADQVVRLDPFWVTIRGGEVVELVQQQYAAP
jgi:cell division protein FtsB